MIEKVIFLDIDGVLNSAAYDRCKGDNDGNIDISRLTLIKRIVDESGAMIVLSSTWKMWWEKDPEKCSEPGQEINRIFNSNGLEIYDKTPVSTDRCAEISQWLSEHPEIKRYVVIDDQFGGWGVHQPYLIKTDYRMGRGIEPRHVEAALKVLKG